MTRTITIDPITRVEGHGKISILLDDQGFVEDAHFHVTQYRGFEKLVEGRPFYEMPSLMARICGICPVSHLIASSQACDAIMAVRIPTTAENLRRMMNLAQLLQSHALHFFHLSSPDLLLGLDSPAEKRHFFGVIDEAPDFAMDGVRLRKIGQEIIAMLGGKRIHPAWVVPGGVNAPLSEEQRDEILSMMPEAMAITQRALDWFKGVLGTFQDEIKSFANFPSLFMGLVDEDGGLEHYTGRLRVVDAAGKVVVDDIKNEDYQQYIGEATEPWSYLKFPYFKPRGYPEGIYRVGPLARLNVVDTALTQWADQELAEFRQLSQTAVLSSFHYHYARLIEMLFAIERIEQLLSEPDILSEHVRAFAEPNAREGVGISEAPRGTLIHHYRVNKQGLMEWANLIIATGHNNLAMNRGVLQVAKRFVRGDRLDEGMLNRVEAVVRAFDPCLSCSSHALGQMPLKVELVTRQGEVLDEITRG